MIIKRFTLDMKGGEIDKQEGNFSLLLLGNILYGGFSPYINKYYDFDFKAFVFMSNEKLGSVFFDNIVYSKFTEEVFNKYSKLKENEELEEMEDYKKIKSEIDELYSNYSPEKIQNLAEKESKDLMVRLVNLACYLLVSTVYSEALSNELIKKLYIKITGSENQFERFLEENSKPVFESFLIRMDNILLERSNNSLYEMQWILCDYSLAPEISKIDSMLKRVISEKGGDGSIRKELSEKTREINKNKINLESYKRTLSDKLKKLFDFAQLTMYLRDVRKEPIQKIFTVTSNLGRHMFKIRGLKAEDARYLFYEDLKTGLYDKGSYSDIISKRKKGSVFYSNGKEVISEYDNFDEVKKQLYGLLSVNNANGELKGNVASKGHVKAKARIVLSESDFMDFKEGEVLITSMTRPEFVPLMKKASAIITDEGGITCHAAIISREINKPCIIGAKTATITIKNGDLIDVDANKGVIKIIKRAK